MSATLASPSALDDKEEIIINAEEFVDKAFIERCSDCYRDVVAAYPANMGKAASKREREEKKLSKNPNFVYGEINFETMGIIMEKIRKYYGKPGIGCSGPDGMLQGRGGTFYDLGSGTGKAIVAAAILHNFDICCGIESLEGLYSISFDMMATYNTKGKSHPILASREYDTHCQIILGDFLNLRVKDWRDGDVVFMNSTCFNDDYIDKVCNIAVGMRKGSFFVSTTKRLPVQDFVVLEYGMHCLSWGDATIYIMQKVTEPRVVKSLDQDLDN